MSLPTRLFTEYFELETGEPWAYAPVVIQLFEGTYSEGVSYPRQTKKFFADVVGFLTFELTVTEGGELQAFYRVTYPAGETFDFTLLNGGDTTLSEQRILGTSPTDPVYGTLAAYINSHLGGYVFSGTPVDGNVPIFSGGAVAWGAQTFAQLIGKPTTLAGYGITDAASDAELATWPGSANITTLGAIEAGSVPASLVTADTFGTGNYVFPADLTVTAKFVAGSTATDPGMTYTVATASTTVTTTGDSAFGSIALTAAMTVAPAVGTTLTSTSAVRGILATVAHSGAGTVTAMIGAQVSATNSGAGIVTRMYGQRILAATNTGGGSVGGVAGLYIGRQTVGTTANIDLLLSSTATSIPSGTWAIYSNNPADSSFAGPVIVGSNATPSAGVTFEVSRATGTAPIVAVGVRVRNTSSSSTWPVGTANYWGFYGFYGDDSTSPPGASERARLTAHYENAAGSLTGIAIWVGPTAGPAVAQSWHSDLSTLLAGGLKLAAGTTAIAPLLFATGVVTTAAAAGRMEYDGTSFHLTNSDATRRNLMLAATATKVTAGAPYANDGYVVVRIGGTDVRVMTTA